MTSQVAVTVHLFRVHDSVDALILFRAHGITHALSDLPERAPLLVRSKLAQLGSDVDVGPLVELPVIAKEERRRRGGPFRSVGDYWSSASSE